MWIRHAIAASILVAGALPLLVNCTPSPPPPKCQPVVTKSFEISKYITVPSTQQQLQAIGEQAAQILQAASCCIEFEESGDLETFSVGDGSIDSQAEYNEVIALPGRVKVVNQVSWCGNFNPSWAGCAPTPGVTFVVEIVQPAQLDAVLWDHEYGHNCGLQHNTTAGNFMNATASVNATGVTAAQCTALKDAATCQD